MSSKHNPDRIHLSQVLAGALAAVTAALLGSTMGVAGTVVGAGLASVVSTVGGALYLRSIQRTRQGVRTVRDKVSNRTLVSDDFGEPTPLVSADEATETAAEPASATDPETADFVEERGGPPDFQPTDEDRQFLVPREGTRRLRWATIVVSSVLTFALGMLAITGFEWLRGESLSGGQGTSFGNIVRPQHDNNRAPDRDNNTDPTTPPSTGPTTSESKPPATTTTPPPSTDSTPPTTSSPPTTTTTETPPPNSEPSRGPTPPAGDAG